MRRDGTREVREDILLFQTVFAVKLALPEFTVLALHARPSDRSLNT